MAWFDELNLPGSTITGHFGFVHEDSPDADTFPDIRLAGGTVRFEPTASAVRAGGAWIGIDPIEARIFEGAIVTSEDDPTPPRILSTDADTGVTGWGWKATFSISGASLKPIRFLAPTTGVHLTGEDLIPITGSPVEVITGATGDSAYEVAVAQGFVGTEDEWLASLKADGLDIRVIALEQDTEWRVAPLDDGLTGRILVRRTADWVTIRLEGVALPVGEGSIFLSTLPPGFRHSGEHYFLADARTAALPSQIGLYNGSRVAWMQGMNGSPTRPGDALSGEYTWRAVDGFPANVTLPTP